MSGTNIRALAKELNLSIGTVSKALRDSYEISAATKKKVLALAQKRNYIANPYASSLRRKKSNTIGVVVPEVADSFFSHAIKGIDSVAQLKGYHVLVYLTYESFAKEQAILKDFTSGRVDGVLVSISSETSDDAHITNLMNRNIPVVFFDRVIHAVATAKITTDDFESGYNATKHLIEQGCDRVAYLSISNQLSINNKRMEGFKEALHDHKLTLKASQIIRCSNNEQENYQLIKKALQRKNNPYGIIASVEKLTPPVYLACKELGVLIPKQLKVVSFSNLETALILNPSLTTINQPAFEMGERAATILFKSIDKKHYKLKNENIIIPSKLIARESSAKGRLHFVQKIICCLSIHTLFRRLC